MLWHLFGSVRLVTADGEVDLGPAKQRCVLAALLLSPGQVVPLATLVDRVWGERPPRAANAVAPYVTRLRRILDAAGTGDTISFAAGGYRLDGCADRVDLHRARRLATEARAARDAADHRRAAGLLREAVEQVDGRPLGGIPGAWAARVRDALLREWLELHAELARALLRSGDHEQVILRLEPLAVEHPTAEPIAGPLMTALAGMGRSAQALDLYARTRAAIVEELGTEPSAALRDIHLELLYARGTTAPQPPPASPPAQLPPAAATYTGRAAELSRLDALLDGGARLIGVWGPPGVGKSALVVHWAHRVRSRFADGQIYLDLRGFAPAGTATDPADAVRHLLQAVGVAGKDVPQDLDARVGLMRTLFAERRILIIVDNAASAGHVRPLLPGGEGCVVVATSRNRLAALVAADGARPLDLGVLPPADARLLLARRVGRRRVEAEPEAADRLVAAGAGCPWPLVTISARAAMEPDRPLSAIAAELAVAGRRLDGLDGDADTDPAVSFSLVVPRAQPPAARLFRLLARPPWTGYRRPGGARSPPSPRTPARCWPSSWPRT
jgi:DNA-binding SARP family transcriptional activator